MMKNVYYFILNSLFVWKIFFFFLNFLMGSMIPESQNRVTKTKLRIMTSQKELLTLKFYLF